MVAVCGLRIGGAALILSLALASTARPQERERLCDSSFENCRTQLLTLIDRETVGIDVAFWFMEDQRYAARLINRWKAGVPVRVLVDPRGTDSAPGNKVTLEALKQAGIPMRKKSGGGVLHWKMMLFAGQDTVQFGSANYSSDAFVPNADYTNYVAETIYYSADPDIVSSFKTRFDDLWTDTRRFSNYGNVKSTTRRYSTYPISADLNFPPAQDYAERIVPLYAAEGRRIDVVMYRVTDRRHTDAIIAAWQRGVPVRYLGEMQEYRDPDRPTVSVNMDRLYAAGIPMRVRASDGLNHEKLVLLYDQRTAVFGSSNWTSASADSQEEHNYFTTKSWMFEWFAARFERRWNNAVGANETTPFVPLPPGPASSPAPADGLGDVAVSSARLRWNGGRWAQVYDVYFGTAPDPPLHSRDRRLGPSESNTDLKSFNLPTLRPGTTYYWKIVSKTAANVTSTSPTWRFTTAPSSP